MSDGKIKFDNIQVQPVSAEFLASCFECSETTVPRYAESKDLPKEDNKYPLFKSLLWYRSKPKKDIEEISEDNPLVRAKLETQNLINAERHIRIKKEVGKLVLKKMTAIYISEQTASIVSRMNNLAFDINLSVGGYAKTLNKIQILINDARNDIAEYINKNINPWMREFDIDKDVFHK